VFSGNQEKSINEEGRKEARKKRGGKRDRGEGRGREGREEEEKGGLKNLWAAKLCLK
jgi:hypothetical protein